MKTVLAITVALPLLWVTAPGFAQSLPDPDRAEPNIKRTVIEDDSARIDELRVRGQTQQVVVTPKRGSLPRYEILIGQPGSAEPDGTGGARGAAGKRVWTVLKF